jgi:hypothetical protein
MVHVDKPQIGRIPRHNCERRAFSPAVRTALILAGTAGLVALAVAIVGSKRIRHEMIELRDAIEPPAEKAWAAARPMRDQIDALFDKASPEGRKALARSLQSWIGHSRAD